jgi:hypothetical protein
MKLLSNPCSQDVRSRHALLAVKGCPLQRGKSYDDQTEDKYELKNRSKGTTVH